MTNDSVFEIASVRTGARLTFSGEIRLTGQAHEQGIVHVALTGGGVAASEMVYDLDWSRWSDIFSGMARDWRGWKGTRVLESVEGQLRISCSADRTGHVEIRVRLRGDIGGADWLAEDAIFLEAGQLEDLAKRAKKYFG